MDAVRTLRRVYGRSYNGVKVAPSLFNRTTICGHSPFLRMLQRFNKWISLAVRQSSAAMSNGDCRAAVKVFRPDAVAAVDQRPLLGVLIVQQRQSASVNNLNDRWRR